MRAAISHFGSARPMFSPVILDISNRFGGVDLPGLALGRPRVLRVFTLIRLVARIAWNYRRESRSFMGPLFWVFCRHCDFLVLFRFLVPSPCLADWINTWGCWYQSYSSIVIPPYCRYVMGDLSFGIIRASTVSLRLLFRFEFTPSHSILSGSAGVEHATFLQFDQQWCACEQIVSPMLRRCHRLFLEKSRIVWNWWLKEHGIPLSTRYPRRNCNGFWMS